MKGRLMNMNRETCKGCRSFKVGGCAALNHEETSPINCPCNVCLIKSVCYSGCELYYNHWSPQGKWIINNEANQTQ